MIHPPPRLVPQTDNMDSHFEVILTRVRELTEQSRSVVWFEIPETADGSVVMVLISESNKISMIHVDYSEESAKLNAHQVFSPSKRVACRRAVATRPLRCVH